MTETMPDRFLELMSNLRQLKDRNHPVGWNLEIENNVSVLARECLLMPIKRN